MIRRANEKDIVAIYNLECELFEESLGINFITNDLKQNTAAYYFVYELEGEIIGYIASWIFDNTTILNFGVKPRFRRQHIGSALFNKLLEYAKMPISLEVDVENEIAIEFYLKNGFEKKALRKDYYKNHHDAILMVRM